MRDHSIPDTFWQGVGNAASQLKAANPALLPSVKVMLLFHDPFLASTPISLSDRGLQMYQHIPSEDTPSAFIVSRLVSRSGLWQRKNYLID